MFMKLLFVLILCLPFAVSDNAITGMAVEQTRSGIEINIPIRVFAGSFNGTSTNFSALNNTELEAVSNMRLEAAPYGMIVFNGSTINLTTMAENYMIDLDSHINITYNTIWINVTALPALDVPATLYLYSLPFTNPRLLADRGICPSTVCLKLNYTRGTMAFNVTGFGPVYSAEEIPIKEEIVEEPSAQGGCIYRWTCSEWTSCYPNNQQTRSCINIGTCPDTWRPPASHQECEYVPSCFDNIQNQGEEDIDCGGPCKPCEKREVIIMEPEDSFKLQTSPKQPSYLWVYPAAVALAGLGWLIFLRKRKPT